MTYPKSAIEIFYPTFLVNLASSHFWISEFTSFLLVLIILILKTSLCCSILFVLFYILLPSPWLHYHIISPNSRLFKLIFEEFAVRIVPRDAPPLESVGPQKCLAFSTDGAKFAIGGEVLIYEFYGIKVFLFLNFLFLFALLLFVIHAKNKVLSSMMFLTTLLHLKAFFYTCCGDYFF